MKHDLLAVNDHDNPVHKRRRTPDRPGSSLSPQGAEETSTESLADESAPRPQQPEDRVCPRCASLNINELFPTRKIDHRNVRSICRLGKLDASSCTICRLFDAVKLVDDSCKLEDDQYELFPISPVGAYLYSTGVVLAVVNTAADKNLLRNALLTGSVPQDRGFITSASSHESHFHPGAFPGRRILPDSIDYRVIRGWLGTCEGLHKKTCVKYLESTKRPSNFTLVDCVSRQVVHDPPSCNYVALSYVWGTYKYATFERPSDGKIPDDLPTTVEDAFRVTKALGLKYVWIDRYCIDQDHEEVKGKQIGEMDLVYRGAHLTIIAAAGDDVYYGLPGVSSRPRSPQPHAWLGDNLLVSILPDPADIIRRSTWMKRMWVYQESHFSARRLVFTDEQIYFECQAGLVRETVDRFTDSRDVNVFSSSDRNEQKPWGIARHLGRYCGREISFNSDVLRAFQGVQHDFETRKPPTHFHCGVPVLPPVIKGKSSGLKAVKRNAGEGFLAGLCWRGDGPGKRRLQYPSWSWAGWTSPIEGWLQEAEKGLRIEEETSITVHAEDCNGNLVSFGTHQEHKAVADILSNFIQIQAWTIELNIQYMTAPSEWIPTFFRTRRWSRGISGHFAVFEDKELILQIAMYSLRFDCDGSVHGNFAPESSTGEILGVVLGRCEDVSDLEGAEGIFIMIVQDQGDHFERIGHMEFKRGYMAIVSKSSGEEVEPQALPWQLCFQGKRRRTIRLG